MAIPDLRQILERFGYRVVERADTWAECFVSNESETWRGRGLDKADALADVVRQMLPSALGAHLLEQHGHEVRGRPRPGSAPSRPSSEGESPPAAPELRAAAKTQRPAARDQGPDAFLCLPARGLFVVADGLKATPAAATAARMAIEEMRTTFEAATSLSPLRMRGLPMMLAAVQRANKEIAETAKREPKLRAMTTAIVAALAVGPQVVVSHIGSTRAYRLRRGAIELLTTDRSSKLEPGKPEPGKAGAAATAKAKPSARALGADKMVEVDTSVIAAQPGDVLLLCTDGLHGSVTQEELTEILARDADPDALVDALLARAADKATAEDATAVVIRWAR